MNIAAVKLRTTVNLSEVRHANCIDRNTKCRNLDKANRPKWWFYLIVAIAAAAVIISFVYWARSTGRFNLNHDVTEETAWRTNGEYTVLYAGYGTLNLFDTDEEYASPFATGASEAIEALCGGYVEPV